MKKKIKFKAKKNVVKLETLKGKEYSLPKNSFYHLIEAYQRTQQKLDALIIVTGSVGSGKSNKAKSLAGTWEEIFFQREYTLDKVHFNADEVVKITDKTDNFTEVINFDEAIQGGSSSAGISRVGKMLRNRLITKRFKRHLYICCVDSLKELNDKLIERCIAWYHVYYVRTPTGYYKKGYYKVFNSKQALSVYTRMKDKRIRNAEESFEYKRQRIINRDQDFTNYWYNEKDYDNKKAIETSKSEMVEDRFSVMVSLGMLELYDKCKYTQQKIGEVFGLSKQSVSDRISKLRKSKEYI